MVNILTLYDLIYKVFTMCRSVFEEKYLYSIEKAVQTVTHHNAKVFKLLKQCYRFILLLLAYICPLCFLAAKLEHDNRKR